jgi:hypothetical protein
VFELHFGDVAVEFVLAGDFRGFGEVVDFLVGLEVEEVVVLYVSDVPVNDPILRVRLPETIILEGIADQLNVSTMLKIVTIVFRIRGWRVRIGVWVRRLIRSEYQASSFPKMVSLP